MIKDKNALLENSGKELFGKGFRHQTTEAVKAQKQSKEFLFKVFQNSVLASPFRKAPRKVSFIAGGKTLASSEEALILVPEDGSTAATRPSLKTHVTRTAAFFKEVSQLIPLG